MAMNSTGAAYPKTECQIATEGGTFLSYGFATDSPHWIVVPVVVDDTRFEGRLTHTGTGYCAAKSSNAQKLLVLVNWLSEFDDVCDTMDADELRSAIPREAMAEKWKELSMEFDLSPGVMVRGQ